MAASAAPASRAASPAGTLRPLGHQSPHASAGPQQEPPLGFLLSLLYPWQPERSTSSSPQSSVGPRPPLLRHPGAFALTVSPQQECSCSSRTRLASPRSPGRVVTRAQAPGRVACVNSSATTGSLWVAAGYLLSCASVPTPPPRGLRALECMLQRSESPQRELRQLRSRPSSALPPEIFLTCQLAHATAILKAVTDLLPCRGMTDKG